MTSWKTPTPSQIDAVLPRLTREGQYRYFFDNLRNPLWILPLRERGMFASPPPPVLDAKRGTEQHRSWPAARYLSRMSTLPEAHEAVALVLAEIPETKNVFVHVDLLSAASRLPPAKAAPLAGQAASWVRATSMITAERAATELAMHLAQGGELAAAVRVARAIFEILPSVPSPAGEDWPRDIRTRLGDGMYEELLRKVLRTFVSVNPMEALRFSSRLLEEAVKSTRSLDGSEDYSYVWRRAIEDHGQNRHTNVQHALVEGVRDAAVEAARADPTRVGEVLNFLNAVPLKVFKRVVVHVAGRCAAVSVAEDILRSRENFADVGLHHEYVVLLQKVFAQLSVEGRREILDWMTGPPPFEGLDERQVKLWRRDRLAPIAGQLPAEERAIYDQLVAEYGASEHADFISYSSDEGFGPTSPLGTEEILKLGNAEILSFLRTFQPSDGPRGTSPEELGRALASAARRDPLRFSAMAPEFKGQDPTYVRNLLFSFSETVRGGQAIEWQPVLDLCEWVIAQPVEPRGQTRSVGFLERDPGWSWTRKAVVSLLSDGLTGKTPAIPRTMRSQVWRPLAELVRDGDPDPQREREAAEDEMSADMLALNSIRGSAMHAVVRYGLWLKNGEGGSALSFADMSEVREVLEAHLDPKADESLAVRSVYGQWFPWIDWLDHEWAANHVDDIFPTGPEHGALFRAAWEAYVRFSEPYNNVLILLTGKYLHATALLDPLSTDEKTRDAETRLAEHLMVFVGRGKIEIAGDSLSESFFAKAPGRLRGRALNFVGWSVGQADGLPGEVSDRFVQLWERRMAALGIQPDIAVHELPAFGSWFASGKFSNSWALPMLRRVVAIAPLVERHEKVMKQLSKAAVEMPQEAVEVAQIMVVGTRAGDGWELLSWERDLADLFKTVLSGENANARQGAVELIDLLGRLGQMSHRALLG